MLRLPFAMSHNQGEGWSGTGPRKFGPMAVPIIGLLLTLTNSPPTPTLPSLHIFCLTRDGEFIAPILVFAPKLWQTLLSSKKWRYHVWQNTLTVFLLKCR